MNEPPDGPRRPGDDDWESHLPDDWEPIPDPRPKVLFQMVAIAVVLAMLVAAAPLAFRLLFGRGPSVPPASPETGTVIGTVLAGPQCPVVLASSPCPDEPIATDLTISQGGEVVGVAASDDLGRFLLVLPPGNYTLLAGSADKPYPRGVPTDVTVTSGGLSEVTLRVDTGLR